MYRIQHKTLANVYKAIEKLNGTQTMFETQRKQSENID